MVKQVRNTIHCLSPHLKSYQTEVWSLMHKFLAFNINSIPRMSNSEADLLANVASKLLPTEGLSPNAFLIELLFRSSIPDNITNWRVFMMTNRSSTFCIWKTPSKMQSLMKALMMRISETSR
jgi:hypothetical protein